LSASHRHSQRRHVADEPCLELFDRDARRTVGHRSQRTVSRNRRSAQLLRPGLRSPTGPGKISPTLAEPHRILAEGGGVGQIARGCESDRDTPDEALRNEHPGDRPGGPATTGTPSGSTCGSGTCPGRHRSRRWVPSLTLSKSTSEPGWPRV